MLPLIIDPDPHRYHRDLATRQSCHTVTIPLPCRDHAETMPNPTQLWWYALTERERDVREGVRTEDERKRDSEGGKKCEREREK